MPDRVSLPDAANRVVRVIPVFLGVAIFAVAGRAEARAHRVAAAAPAPTVRHGDVLRLPVAQARTHGGARTDAPAPATGVTVYLDRHGGRIAGGVDDAAGRRSWIAASAPGGGVTIPAWAGGEARWQKMVACVRAGFGPLAIEIVDDQPAASDYTLIMVGGTPDLIGYGDSVAGVAPSGGGVLRGAVGYVFSANLDSEVDATCESALHEIGHTLGLDHTFACGDLMSYEACGAKRFVDADVPCGESEARACDGGGRTQNSWRMLVEGVGFAPGKGGGPGSVAFPGGDEDEPVADSEDEPVADSEDEPVADSDSDTDTDPDPGCDGAAADDATVAIVGLDDTVAGNRWLPVDIEAHASAGVEDVALTWSQGTDEHAWVCSEPTGPQGVTCERDGDHFRFWIPAGVGTRALVAIVRDGAGHVVTGEPRTVELVDAAAQRRGGRHHRHRHP